MSKFLNFFLVLVSLAFVGYLNRTGAEGVRRQRRHVIGYGHPLMR